MSEKKKKFVKQNCGEKWQCSPLPHFTQLPSNLPISHLDSQLPTPTTPATPKPPDTHWAQLVLPILSCCHLAQLVEPIPSSPTCWAQPSHLIRFAQFVLTHFSSYIHNIFNFFHWIQVQEVWGSRFKPEVRVRPLPEPEPAKRFRFRYSAEPDSWTSGSESGLEGSGTGLWPVHSTCTSTDWPHNAFAGHDRSGRIPPTQFTKQTCNSSYVHIIQCFQALPLVWD